MFRLSLAFITIFVSINHGFSQSIHGDKLSVDCLECHTTDSWKIDINKLKFDHSTTEFNLSGQHRTVDCRSCHRTLKFEKQNQECISCHTDFHLGNTLQDCQLCHNTNSWINPNSIEIHQFTRFPLVGPHINAECEDCHTSSSPIDFQPIEADCFGCHFQDYINSQIPNHVTNNLSQDCEECHTVNLNWTFYHNTVYPLLGGHNLVKNDCLKCHDDKYLTTSTECVSCHITDYNMTTNPNHLINQFSQDCEECHTFNPGWTPSTFDHDGLYFPIYSGDHKNEWDDCSICHINLSNYSEFSCLDCHEHNQAEMDDEHDDEADYVYNSYSCYDCHPDGSE